MKATHEHMLLHYPNTTKDEVTAAMDGLMAALSRIGVTHVTKLTITAKTGERLLDIDWIRMEKDDEN